MTDLVEFINARLAEDEAHAKKDLHMLDRASNGGAWEYGVGYNLPYSELGPDGSIGRLTATYGRVLADGEPDQHNADVMLVARMVRSTRRRADRVLRDVEAKRTVLFRHVTYATRVERAGDLDLLGLPERLACDGCGWDDGRPRTPTVNDCPELRALAAPYADHPDYRPEWSLSSVTPPE